MKVACFQSCAIKVACTRSKFSGLSYKCLDLIIRCRKRRVWERGGGRGETSLGLDERPTQRRGPGAL